MASSSTFPFFSEGTLWQGKGAPSGVHPNNLRKEGKLKINWTQRAPRRSQDIRENPEKYAVLKEIMGNILEFIHDNVSSYLFISLPCHVF